jgi:hypothetical protein
MITDVEGQFAGTFTWGGAEQTTHAGASSALTANLIYAGGPITLLEVENLGTPSTGFIIGVCSNSLIVDMVLEFATDDGVFAEVMVVQVQMPGPEANIHPWFSRRLDLDAMTGTLAASDFVLDGGVLADLSLSGELRGAGLTGDLQMMIEFDTESAGIVQVIPLADYDAAPVP